MTFPPLDHDNIALVYDFWNKNLLQKTKIYMEIIIKEDDIITKHKQFPVFKEYYKHVIKLLDEKIKEPDKDLTGFAPSQMAGLILYILSGISGIGLNQGDFRLYGVNKMPRMVEYFLNTIDILGWYKQTQEYKVWKEEQEWREAHPMYSGKPKDDREFARMIALANKNIKSGKYTRDKVLKKLK
jgi:hypothetical protein